MYCFDKDMEGDEMMKEQQSQQYQSRLCKIVYFDEESVTDYIQIVKGGRLEKTTELLNETKDKGQAGVDAKASVGIGGVLKALVGLELKTNVDTELETSFNTNQMAKNILKNTILTDFINLIDYGIMLPRCSLHNHLK